MCLGLRTGEGGGGEGGGGEGGGGGRGRRRRRGGGGGGGGEGESGERACREEDLTSVECHSLIEASTYTCNHSRLFHDPNYPDELLTSYL